MLLAQVENEIRDEANRRLREIEQEVKEEADERARKIIATTMQRLTSEVVSETTVSVVPIPSEDMKGRIIGREGRNIRALEHATGVDVIIDDTPDAVTLSGFDPVRREIARIALTKLLTDGRIHPARIEEMVEKAKQGSRRRRSRRPARRRSSRPSCPGLHPEIVRTLGRLKFRYSYGQNQLSHAVETANLAAMIAHELGANVEVARRGGLLHDIGKAIDHEVEGTHAALGAELARRHGVHPAVVHCIEAHHEEVEPSLRRGDHHDRRRRDQRQPARRPPRVAGPVPQAAGGAGGGRQRLPGRREVVRHPGRPRGPHHRQAGRSRRPRRRPHGQGDQQAHPGEPGLPGPDQGHRHPRAALGRVREVVTVGGGVEPVPPRALGDAMPLERPADRGYRRQAGPPDRGLLSCPASGAGASIDLVIANGENTAGGTGPHARAPPRSCSDAGVDIITSGNHIWENREIYAVPGRPEAPAAAPAELPGGHARPRRPRSATASPSSTLMGRTFMGVTHRLTRSAPLDAALEQLRGLPRHHPRLPRRGDEREDSAGLLPGRPRQRRRRHAHPRPHRRHAHPPQGHRLRYRPRHGRRRCTPSSAWRRSA